MNFGKYADYFYCLMRLVVGFLYACHGAQKLFGVLGAHGEPPAGLFLVGGIIEFVCGILIGLGLLTRLGAFLASGEMAVAYFMMHAPHSPWPIINKGEPAVVYAFLFLYIALRGGGPWSIDAMWGRRGTPPA